MKMRALSLIVVLSVMPLALCFAEDNSPGKPLLAVVGADGKQQVDILGGSYFFKPDHIIVKLNKPVVLSVRREWGIVPHTFVMEVPAWGLKVDESIYTKVTTITFTPTSLGRYTFYCKNKFLFFRSHKDKGMKGILEVVP